jgi:N-methylhydantoinase A
LGEDHELVMIRAIVQARSPAIADVHLSKDGRSLEECKVHDSRIYHEGQWHDAGIYNRSLFHEGLVINGAAVIVEMDSTTVVLPGYRATVDAIGNLLITAIASGDK